MIELSIAEVITHLGARSEGGAAQLAASFPSLSIDSRTIRQGQCFMAVKGDRYDGHDFIEDALNKGAAVIIQSDPVDPHDREDRLFLQVEETQKALQELASLVRTKWTKPLLAISGSMGKTTTREFTTILLEERYRVFQSPRNLNNQIGVPLSLLELRDEHELAVLELGMNHAGEIRRLASICRPDAGLLTNVAAVHLEFFPDLEAIARAKGELLEELTAGGKFFFNGDDPRLSSMALGYSGETISFGLGAQSQIRVGDYHFRDPQRMEFRVFTPGWELAAAVPFVGKHFLYNIVGAVAVAHAFGLTREEIQTGIGRLEAPCKRGRLRRLGRKGNVSVTVWDDSYNSNPAALIAVLEAVGQLPGFLRKVLALGDMLELGHTSAQLHRQCGQQVALCQPDLLVTVGPQAEAIGRGAGEAGFLPSRMAHFETAQEAGEFLAGYLQEGDLLLVKGSRGVGMDRLIQRVEERLAS